MISLVLHLIAAWCSIGFYHADEHFQIVEFAFYKLGLRSAQDLPLEFSHLLRPWFFPAILVGLTRSLQFFGIESPFTWALSYRLMAGFLGWLSVVSLAAACRVWFREPYWQRRAVYALVLLWYIPALHVRHSSENLAGAVFFTGLAALVLLGEIPSRERNARPLSTNLIKTAGFLVGILFGVAFQLRYQVGVMIGSTFIWLAWIAPRTRAPNVQIFPRRRALLPPIILGIIIITLLGLVIDRWGYGQWTLTPWNYLKYNLIQNHVGDMDTSPWWDYFRRATTESWPILGALSLIAWIAAWISYPRHILTWSTLPFFVVHLLIGHKELRFLFPIAHVGGLLIVLACQRKIPLRLRQMVPLGIVWNILALITLTITPAWAPMAFYSQLYSFVESRPLGTTPIYYQDDRFLSAGGARIEFYLSPRSDFHFLRNYGELTTHWDLRTQCTEELPKNFFKEYLTPHPPRFWLFFPFAQLTPEKISPPEVFDILIKNCEPEFSTLNPWVNEGVQRLAFLFHPGRITNWTLFQCRFPSLMPKAQNDTPKEVRSIHK